MKAKKSLIIMVSLCGTAVLGLAAVPDIVLDNVPTAAIVNVATVEYEDDVSLSGTVMRDPKDNTFFVQVYVPEKDISKVRIGQTAYITGDAFPDRSYDGTVEKISDTALKIQAGNVQKTAVEVSVGINEPDETLKHGYTASVRLCTSRPSLMTVVPYEAVGQDDNGEYVYYLKNGRAYKRYVTTGKELSEGVELKTGFSEDETIITVDRAAENGSAVRLDRE